MRLVNLIKSKTFIFLVLFTVAFFATRIPALSTDEINPDGVNWHYRSQQFIVGLKTFDLLKTYQHYHPGVTLMWIMGIPVELIKQFDPANAIISNTNFLTFHFASKLSLIVVQFKLTLLIWFFLRKLTGTTKAFLVVTLFTFEPFFVGNSRVLHMDVLLSLLLFLGLLTVYLYFEGKATNIFYGLLGGLFLSMSFLTKSVGILGICYVLAMFISLGLFCVFKKKCSLADSTKMILPILAGFIISTFVFFPAMLQKPVWVIEQIFTETERVGIRKGHGQVLFGEYTRDGGVFYYPLVLLLKVSPFMLIGVLFFLTLALKNAKLKNSKEWLVYFSVFYIGYLLVMTFPSKKIDRYIIPMFPYFALLAVLGFHAALDHFRDYKEAFTTLLAIFCSVFMIAPLLTLFPYYFTYTSPLFGNAQSANKVIAQKSFGMGIVALKELIFDKYGSYPNLGFIDTKPMGAVYMNSRIFDIRTVGTNKYSVLVLGVNDEFNEDLGNMNIDLEDPTKVILNGTEYAKDTSLYINGLEYWKVYVKKTSK